VDISSTRASYSNVHTTVDVAAPGGETGSNVSNSTFGNDGVLSTWAATPDKNDIYGTKQGTSFAAPHMAGVVALMRQVKPDLTAQEVDDLLASGRITDDLGLPGRDETFGFGLIDANAAVVEAGELNEPPPALSVSPAGLNFATTIERLTLTARNGGGGDLQVTSAVATYPAGTPGGWLTITRPSAANRLGTYQIDADRSGLPPDIYPATITFSSNAGTVRVRVQMEVPETVTVQGDIGVVYVLLVNDATGDIFDDTATISPDGTYSYAIPQLKPGTYTLYAGTDMDNDGFICDAGEACGSYLTIDDPSSIDLRQNELDLDFGVEFSSDIEDLLGSGGAAEVASADQLDENVGHKRLARRIANNPAEQQGEEVTLP
jgi:serine protease